MGQMVDVAYQVPVELASAMQLTQNHLRKSTVHLMATFTESIEQRTSNIIGGLL
jgi:hypothetical protein